MKTVDPITLALEEGYRFRVDFGIAGSGPLVTDATPPLGRGTGPDSEQLLVAAVANCLAASLVFALRKFRNEVPVSATADATLVPNAQGRLRVSGIRVRLSIGAPARDIRLLERALTQYEDFCVVTQSVRAAIPVAVQVVDGEGVQLAP